MPGTKLILALFCAIAPYAFCGESPYEIAVGQVKSGNCAAAVRTMTPALHAATKPIPAAYLLVSVCQTQMEQSAEAEATLRNGLAAHPGAAVLERALGELLMHAHSDSPEAGHLLAQAVTHMPGDPEARHYYAQWAYMNSLERVCTTQEQAALRLPGLNDTALLQMNTLLAICVSRLKDTAGARSAFRRANEINLRQKNYDPVAAWEYMQFLGRVGDQTELQSIVDQILERVPEFGPARLERAKRFDRAGRPAQAVEEARLVLKGVGNDFNIERAAHAILARSFTALGRADEASREQAWIESHPNPETPR